MKLFALYTTLDLIDKPVWLDDYRKKYGQFYDLHVTLKQPCYIEESQLPSVKNKLSVFFKNLKLPSHEISLVFEKLVADNSDPSDGVIMIQAQSQATLELQKKVISELSDFTEYYEPASKEWEENFKPHITIASNLDPKQFQLAQNDLPDNYTCEGLIKNVSLSIIDPKDADNVKAQADVIVYNL